MNTSLLIWKPIGLLLLFGSVVLFSCNNGYMEIESKTNDDEQLAKIL